MPAPLPFQPGDLIGGRYRLLRMIGAGAMGAVWSARNESTDRDFALKLMLPDAAQNPVALHRFFQEAKASGRLRHRCIVEVYDLGRIEQLANTPHDPRAGTPYLVMELLEGEPLDSVLRRITRLPWGTALRLIADVARALEIAHGQRIVHRDLKPANLFLHKTLDGPVVPKILDFGISKLIGPQHDPVATSTGTVLGSPAYMSPEQAMGELAVDGRSDVWSLGVILYKCLCGSVPFSAPNYNALMLAICSTPATPIHEKVPGLSPEVSEIVHRCLAKKREDRFQTAKSLAEAIDALLAQRVDLTIVDLAYIASIPEELSPEDAKTIGLDPASVRSLAATEAGVATRVQERPPVGPVASDTGGGSTGPHTSTRPMSGLPAPTRPSKVRYAIVAAGMTALVALAALVGAVASRSSARTGDAAAARAQTEEARRPPTIVVGTEEMNEPTGRDPAPVAAVPSASVSASVSASASTIRATGPRIGTGAPTHSGPSTKASSKAQPSSSAAHPANEGVTGAGF